MELDALIERYCAVWNSDGFEERLALLREVWTPEATYTDPTVHAATAVQLSEHIAGVRLQWPGLRIVRTSAVDCHHGIARFFWRVELPDGAALPEGLDIAFLNQDETRIARIVGFFGPLKPA